MSPSPPLIDRYGRAHTYLRVSVTDRCNFRCVYCMPEEGLDWMPRDDILTYEEIARLVRIFVGMGVRRVRLTGGEPLIRRDLERLVAALGAIEGLDDLAMTTNAHRLAGCAETLARSGLTRLNVSLDSLDPETFARLTRGGRLDKVLAGIDAARAAGLTPIKINAVILRGENDHEVPALVEHFSAHAADTVVRFIEYMPFDARWHRSVRARELRTQLSRFYTLDPWGERMGDGPAVYWRVRETGLRIGFISPLSEKFCSTCNRLRMMANGHLRTCLSDDGTPSLRDLLRGGATDDQLAAVIRAMVLGKREGHGCTVEGGVPFEGVMTRVGG
ncbi:MAG: GTP 3',8-cyclase MoaA [Alphaproteobacteria bacterium]|nr:GTP 3',8-cyclase MoaA [Alphaproteobacteria bacterium]